MSYQISVLEHPADIRLKITASSKKDLFQGALKGMTLIIAGRKIIKKGEQLIAKQIEVLSPEKNTLLVDFLNEVLAKTDIYHSVFPEIEIEELTERKIRGTIKGQKVKEFKEEIKAATYHGLDIVQNEEGLWEVIILFDV